MKAAGIWQYYMRSKKPLIGITLSQALKVKYRRSPMKSEFDYLAKYYHYAIEKTGGRPIGLFNTNNFAMIKGYLDLVDGLIFTGGYDLDSKYFHQRPHPRSSKPREPRDWFELALLKEAIKLKKPIFCICRGHQLFNVARGGNLYQDLSLINTQLLKHHGDNFAGEINHPVKLQPGSLLHDVIGCQNINCNSSHHQAIDKIGKGLIVSAKTSDGIIEGLELVDYPFLLSVQWHPERIFKRAHARRLFEAFISASKAGT